MAAITLPAAGLFLLLLSASVAADEFAFKRVADAALASSIIPVDAVGEAKADCDTALCFARMLAKKMPREVRLEAIDHADSDSIRWVKTAPSIHMETMAGGLTIEVSRFGRKVLAELQNALASASTDEPLNLSIDLRGNKGGDFERMLTLAGLLIGPHPHAIDVDHGPHVEKRALEGPIKRNWRVTSVAIDRTTASAALLLARLLETHAGVEVMGPPTDGTTIFLKRRITIDHDWRLLLPVAELRVTPP